MERLNSLAVTTTASEIEYFLQLSLNRERITLSLFNFSSIFFSSLSFEVLTFTIIISSIKQLLTIDMSNYKKSQFIDLFL